AELSTGSKTKPGKNLGKTTGWIHRASLKMKKLKKINEVVYQKIDDLGLHFIKNEKRELLEADNVVICAGQEPLRELAAPLVESGLTVHIIGGAEVARELDAKRAIEQGARLAANI